jgi:nicotinate-nucleotide adenylyltransferase
MALVSRSGRIGILGGTFDPIHLGHTDTAMAARDALQLDPVVLMPARVPPHREQGPAASMFHRFAMAALAASGLPGVSVSDDELRTDGPSYTAQTLARLSKGGLSPTGIFFITGADAFAEIETWYRYPAVLELAHFVVVSRPGMPASTVPDRLPALRERFCEAPAPGTSMPARPSVFLVDRPTSDVSSTTVRQRLRSGLSITGLVPPAVEAHIIRHHLYMASVTADHVK